MWNPPEYEPARAAARPKRAAHPVVVAFLAALVAAGCSDGLVEGPQAEPEGPVLALEGMAEPDFGPPPVGATLVFSVSGPAGDMGVDSVTIGSDGHFNLSFTLISPCTPEDGTGALLTAEVTLRDADFYTHPTMGPTFERALHCQEQTQTLDFSLERQVFSPMRMQGVEEALHVMAGSRACAATVGDLYCWGMPVGVLTGGGPAPLPDGEDFVQVVQGLSHFCALDSAGAAWCWGRDRAQLGVEGVTESMVPLAVETDHRFAELAAGRWATCGRKDDGDVWCWGQARGVGSGEEGAHSVGPVKVALDRNVLQISSVFSHTCAVDTDGDLWCWGWAYRGEMGSEQVNGHAFSPVPVAFEQPIEEVAAGNTFTCARDAGGEAWCWGTGWDGQLGTGSASPSETAMPVKVTGGHTFTALNAGQSHACGVDDEGRIFCWGSNSWGQLGGDPPEGDACQADDPNGRCSWTPVEVDAEVTFTSVSAGDQATCGITTDGETYCWGSRAGVGIP